MSDDFVTTSGSGGIDFNAGALDIQSGGGVLDFRYPVFTPEELQNTRVNGF